MFKTFNFGAAALVALTTPALAQGIELPTRQTPIPETTDGVPHIQIGIEAVPELSDEMVRRVEAVEGIEIHPTIVSLPGALGFMISEDVELARPEAIVRGREFAHIHPDGSLHASLSPELAAQAVETGWAVMHPWADERENWDGFVMIFTPTNADELEVVLDLVEQSFAFVTGQVPEAF